MRRWGQAGCSRRILRGVALERGTQRAGFEKEWVHRKWIACFLLGGILLLSVSCTSRLEDLRLQEKGPDVSDVQPQMEEASSLREAEFHFAMEMLQNGDFEGARETLSEIAARDEPEGVPPRVAFALGVIKLLEMEDMERMRACRDYFQGFADEHPEGPYREDAERIVQILNGHIARAEKEQRQIRELSRKVSDQEKVIQTLQYKIEKLEEIHRETEEKRHLLEGE